jgi:hypothetical protein
MCTNKRVTVAALCGLCLVAASPAGRAASLLFVAGDAPPLNGEQRLLTGPDDVFQVIEEGLLIVTIGVFGDVGDWYLTFQPPLLSGGFAPGTYEGAHDFADLFNPQLHVEGEGLGCSTSTGRFVVHEVTFDPSGFLLTFAADFERLCEGDPALLRGALRYRSGDEGCTGAVDGTPCDDQNPCTSADVCLVGACAGTDDVTSGCMAGGPCLPAGVCDPSSGACTVTTEPDGTVCDDASACTTGERCVDGVCSTGVTAPCDDADPCTTDQCVPATGCEHEPVDGTCWRTRTALRIVASASAGGRSARCAYKCAIPETGALILGSDGTYRVPSGQLVECTGSNPSTFPDEVGTVRAVRQRRLVFEPDNLDDLFAAAAACIDEENPFRSYRGRVKLSRDGTTFKGKTRLRGRVPGRVPVRVRAIARITGADVASGLEPPAPSRKSLPACTGSVQLRCRVQ